MRRSWATCGGATLLLLATMAQSGCKQKEGDRCQLNSDCADNLTCCVRPTPADRAKGGVCTLKCELQGDVGVPAELGVKEAGAADKAQAKDTRAPDTKVTAPDQKTATPDQKTVTPDQKTVTPDQKTVTPDVKPAQ